MLLSLLFIGFLLGMRHALEADHVAAVASLATRSSSIRQTALQGAFWGVGHTLTLFLFGSAVLMMDTMMSELLADFLEFAVGIMLIALGCDVLWRLYRERIHFHVHRHNDIRHFHAHSHAGEGSHRESRHQHEHRQHGSMHYSSQRLTWLYNGLHGLVGVLTIGIGSMTVANYLDTI